MVLTDILDDEGKHVAADLGADAVFVHHDVSQERDWVDGDGGGGRVRVRSTCS